MGWRFRKSVRLMPGIRLNFSKSGVSTSVGGPGATMNFGSSGTRTTVGIPGSGISYSKLHSSGGGTSGAAGGSNNLAGGCGCLALIALVLMIARCGGDTEQPSKSKDMTTETTASDRAGPVDEKLEAKDSDAGSGETVYVDSETLNGRSEPSLSAPIEVKLTHGDALRVVERKGDWVKVLAGAASVWVASRHISNDRPAPRTVNNGPTSLMSVPRKKTRRSGGYGGGQCPCSSGSVCIGPRGGRYCITSSGNKRYGV